MFQLTLRGSIFLAALALGGIASGQNYTSNDTLNILTQDDGGFCRPQAGAWWPDYYNAGCCGSPGNRVCARVLHFGKGSYGDSAGCTDPDDNRTQHSICMLPDPQPMSIPNGIQPGRDPQTGTDIWFLVTSDLHFYRDWYNVADQTAHPYTMNLFALKEWQAGHPYAATMIVGDMTTGPNRERLGAYRLLWEKQWLSFGSTILPTFPTLGNHDSDANTPDFWNYLSILTQNPTLHVDRNYTGCLLGVDVGCWDNGGVGGSLNYSWDWQGVHMVMLNTWAGDHNLYVPPFGSDGMTWLTKDLAHYVGNSNRPVIIFQHYGINDNNTVDTNHNWWTLQNVKDFEAKLANYNVIGWFSGHTHDLGYQAAPNTVNLNNGDLNGVGQTLDNLVDGAGGDCENHGTKDTNEAGRPWTSTYCSGADANFMAVHINDNTMTVRTLTYNNSKSQAPFDDTSIGLAGTGTGPQSGCVKRFGSFKDVTASVTFGFPGNGNTLSVHNNSSTPITGPLAVMVGNGLTQWDFTDSCLPGAHTFLRLTHDDLAANATLSIQFQANSNLNGLHLYQLNDSLVLSQNSILVGSQPVTVTLSTVDGRSVPFSYEVPFKVVGTVPNFKIVSWLKVTADSATTPAHLTVSLTNPSEAIPGNIVITAGDPSIPTVNLPVTANAPLTITSASPGALVNQIVNVPQTGGSLTVPEHLPVHQQFTPATFAEYDVPSPQFPSAGTRYTFNSWTGGGTKNHTFQIPLDGVSLSVNFDVAYQVTTTASPGGSVALEPASPDGYYASGTPLTVAAKPAQGYRLVGFNGALSGTTSPRNVPVSSPLTIGATFSNTVSVTVAAQPYDGIIYVDNVAQTGTNTYQWRIGDKHTLDASKTDDGGGKHQAFQSWSNGQPPKFNFVVPDTDTVLTANLNVSYLLTLNATANGTLSASPSSPDGYYTVGTPVTVTAIPAAGYYLTDFSSGLGSALNPQTLTMKGPVTIGATFQSNPNITVTVVPSNAVIYIDNVAYTGTNTFPWIPGSLHTLDASKTDNGGGTHQAFTKWNFTQPSKFSYQVGHGNSQVTATFAMSYQLTLNASPNGTLAASPSSPDGFYADGTPVTVTASPAANYFFGSFTGALGGTTNPQIVTMSQPRIVGTTFTSNPVTTVSTSNDPLAIAVDGVSMQTPAQLTWTPGTSHTIAMSPVQTAGAGVQYLFIKWSDGVTANSRTIVAGSSNAAYQLATVKQFSVTATANPAAGGTVGGGGWYTQGTQATLSATGAGGYAFSGFSGDAPAASSPDIFTVNAPANVVANFTPAQPQLKVNGALVDDSSSSVLKLGLTMVNSGAGNATSIQIVSITATVLSGTGTVATTTALPLNFGNLAGGTTSLSQETDFNWPTSATRVRLTINYKADGGAYSGTQTLTLFR